MEGQRRAAAILISSQPSPFDVILFYRNYWSWFIATIVVIVIIIVIIIDLFPLRVSRDIESNPGASAAMC